MGSVAGAGSRGGIAVRSVRSRAMNVAVPKEHAVGERRVALTPDAIGRLEPLGLKVVIETGAGNAAALPDAAYREAGATVVSSAA